MKPNTYSKLALCITFILVALFSIKPAFSESDYFTQAKEAFNSKNFSKALSLITLADKAKPNTDYIQFWHGLILYNNKNYSESITVFEKLDFNYYTFSTQWYIADSYLKVNKPDKSVAVIEKVIPPNLKAIKETKDFYGLYLQALIAQDSKNKLISLDKTIIDYYNIYPDDLKNYHYYLLSKSYLNYAKKYITENNTSECFKLYLKALALYKISSLEYQGYYNFYEITEILKGQKNYVEVLKYYDALPKEYFSSYERLWFYAEAYENINNLEQAKTTLLQALSLPKEEKPYWKNFIYFQLSLLCSKTEDFETIKKLIPELTRYFSIIDDAQYENTRYYLLNLLEKTFYKAMHEHNTLIAKDTYNFIKQLATLKTKTTKAKDNEYLNQFAILFEANDFYAKNYASLKTSAYKHKILLAPFKYVDATWLDKDKKLQSKKNTFNENEIDEYKKTMELFNELVFYMTKGKVLIEYEIEIQESTITKFEYSLWKSDKNTNGKSLQEVDILSPDLNSTRPYSLSLFSSKINDYDTFALIFPSEGITNICTGSKTKLQFVPYILNSSEARGKIIMASESMDPFVFFHEFFHTVEGTYNNDYKFTMHVYKKEYADFWPAWYKGEGELPYYQYIFNKIITPLSFNKLHYKESIDTTSADLLSVKTKDYKTMNVENLKKAQELQTEAWDIYSQKPEKALPKFLDSFNLYPNDSHICEVIGYLYYKKSDYKTSLKYYLLHEALLKEINQNPNKDIQGTIAWLKTKI